MSQRNTLYYIFSVVRIFLYPFALIYGAIVWLRNRLYNTGFFSSVTFSVPVISVGNLSVGGTGKTPHVEYLINLLQYQFKVATMSRGYKRRTQGFMLANEKTNALHIGDEPMQYHMKYPELIVSVAEERMTGIPLLLQRRPDAEVILLDDAYQHRSVKAGVNILITDYSKPFYKDFVLPLGRLRESRSAYKRADVIIVSKCPPALDRNAAAEIEKQIRPLPHQQVFFTTIQYQQPYSFLSREPISLAGKNIVLVCCIAQPEPLVQYLKTIGADVHVLSYIDHHYFSTADIEEINAAYDNWDVTDKIIITTEKDAARLQLHTDKLIERKLPLAILPIAVSILFNRENDFHKVVLDYVEKTLTENQTYYGEEEQQ